MSPDRDIVLVASLARARLDATDSILGKDTRDVIHQIVEACL